MSTILAILAIAIAIAIVSVGIHTAVFWFYFIKPLLTDGTEDDPYGNPNDPPGDVPHYPVVTIKGEPHPYLGHPGCEPPVKGRAG